MVKINEYIESGILEAYVLGSASESEAKELLYLKTKYPELERALFDLESDFENIAQHMAINPPPHLWAKIEDNINEIVNTHDFQSLSIEQHSRKNNKQSKNREFIDVDSKSSHMRVHKIWRWILLAIFVLGKIFLGFAIYFYLENRQVKEQIQELKTELKRVNTNP